ncbi:MAG: LysR family transcriptional regulator [Pseudomonadota bacterium]
MKRHRSGNKLPDPPQGLRCRGRVWIEKDGETYLGFGRMVLLEKIKEFGSISQAAKSMAMSYKHAWDLVDSMNRQAAEPLVSTSKGGKGGGGAILTEAGEAAIMEFTGLLERLDAFLAEETARLPIRT